MVFALVLVLAVGLDKRGREENFNFASKDYEDYVVSFS